MTNTRPPATAGPAYLPPTGVRQSIFNPSLGKWSIKPVLRQTPSRRGPSHCGQSSARMAETHPHKTNVARRVFLMLNRIKSP